MLRMGKLAAAMLATAALSSCGSTQQATPVDQAAAATQAISGPDQPAAAPSTTARASSDSPGASPSPRDCSEPSSKSCRALDLSKTECEGKGKIITVTDPRRALGSGYVDDRASGAGYASPQKALRASTFGQAKPAAAYAYRTTRVNPLVVIAYRTISDRVVATATISRFDDGKWLLTGVREQRC